MSEDLHHIDDLFKSGFEGKEETPSPAVWENIEKELDKKDSRPKFFYWWNTRRIAAAILILGASAGLFAGGYYLGIKKETRAVSNEEKRGPVVPGSAGTGDPVLNSTTERDRLNSNQSGEDQVNNAQSPQKDAIGNSNARGINDTEQSGTEQVENNSGEKTSNKSNALIPVDPRSASNQVAGNVKKNSPIEQQAAKKPSNTVGVKNNGSKPPVSTDKSQPVFTSEKSPVGLTGQTTEPVLAESTSRNREAETITAGSLSRGLPETQKQIPVNKTTPVTTVKLPVSSSAQEATQSSIPVLNKRSSSLDLPKFSFTPVAGLQFGSNKIVATNDPHANHVKTDIDRTESQPMSISGGILADLKIARNMTVQSGIVFTSRTIEIEPKYVKAERNPDGKVRYKFDCSAGTYYIKKSTYARPGDSALTIFSTNELNYINIPLALTYHFGGKKFSFFATAGAGLNLLTDQYLETGLSNYSYDENESIATNLKSSYLNGMVGAGVTYRPFKKVSFLFSPQYQFALSPMNENMPVKAYPRIFNMQLGMQIRLK
jgi:hypothetical protein